MTYAIKAENLGKCYLIGHRKKEAYSTLRDTLAHGVQNIWQRLRHPNIPAQDNQIEEFWALKDVSFEIQPGDRVGIIGRNGAGKSTLLKVLSRITEPTTGKFITRGRVASLLEVGTGFHPELTGRENIYLNGSILGMTRADVKRQFDAIVDFSGVEKFLDTPVKRYSSGMYVRLAFAVAAHLDPDILIVDEVLAVGDAEFQKKCLGKMEEVGKEGRTVVFVSHNMGAVRRLCDKGILVSSGCLIENSTAENTISKYHSEAALLDDFALRKSLTSLEANAITIESIQVYGLNGANKIDPTTGSQLHFEFRLAALSEEDLVHAGLIFCIDNIWGNRVAWFNSENSRGNKSNPNIFHFVLETCPFTSGEYFLSTLINVKSDIKEYIQHSVRFNISEGAFFDRGPSTLPNDTPTLFNHNLM